MKLCYLLEFVNQIFSGTLVLIQIVDGSLHTDGQEIISGAVVARRTSRI